MRVECLFFLKMQANSHMLQAAFLRLYISSMQAASSPRKGQFLGKYFCNKKKLLAEHVM